jgi:SAM-dependent methyltransferase
MTDLSPPVLDFDPAAAERFTERFVGMLNGGAVAVMCAVGHRTRLFDTMATLPPSTSQEIAEAAGLAERYVREWLACMVTGGIVLYDPATATYRLPPEHAAILTRDAPLGNFAVPARFVAQMGAVQDLVVDCLETGGGTTYDQYPCFHEVMAEDSGQTVVPQLFDTLLPLAPDLTPRLEHGIDVLDAGCGRAQALLAMAERFPESRFLGLDLCADAIGHARETAAVRGLANIAFETVDLSRYAATDAFDLVTSFDAVHDQKDPAGLVRTLHDALRAGGVYFMQDIGGSAQLENNLDFVFAPLLYAISTAHCTPVSIGQGGPGLGTMWGWETAEALLRDTGFATVTKHVLPHDPMNVWFVAQKG